MRVTGLQISNFKVIKAITIKPEGNVVVISGSNGAGKSSTLDAIWAAIAGGAAMKETPQPIREGQTRAEVVVTTEKYKITRTWTQKGSYLTLEDTTGKLEKPQQILDMVYSDLTFDPLEFARQDSRTQKQILIRAAHLEEKMQDFERKSVALFDERTLINREVKKLEGQTAGAAALTMKYPEVPGSEVNVGTLGEEILAAKEMARSKERDSALYQKNMEKIAALTAENLELKKKWEGVRVQTAEEIVMKEQELANAQERNAAFAAHKAYKDVCAQLDERRLAAEACTKQLEALAQMKEDMLRTTPMPIPGVTFSEDGVLINNIPFAQLSSAQKLKVSLAIAMAARPELRIIRIMDGSLLDESNMKVIEQMAKDNDYQIWMEVVDQTGKRGIVIEEGEVKAVNPPIA